MLLALSLVLFSNSGLSHVACFGQRDGSKLDGVED